MIAPYQLLQCRDAALAAVPNERIWRRFCDALGRPQWADEERYRINQRRIENRAGLIEQIEAVMRERTSAEWQWRFWHGTKCRADRCSQSRRFSGCCKCKPATT
jgi:crotonobetainyl-CoA:carnitine CoA-transferase CaiB-like acyl-CoA transferase